MATTLVGYTTANADNDPSATISLPVGTVDSDVLVLFISKDGSSLPPTPSGFTQQYNAPSGGSHTDSLFWKAASAEPSSYTILMAGNERAWLWLAAYREVDNSDPFASFASEVNPTSDQNMVIPQITRDIANQMCVALIGTESGNSGNPLGVVWPNGYTTVSDNEDGPPGTGGGSSAGAAASQQTATTGPLGPGTATYGGGNSHGTALAFALREGAPPQIAINSTDGEVKNGDTGIEINGFGFEPVQGSGKVEIGDSSDYATATLVEQAIASWSDTQILYDATGLNVFADGFLFLFVTDSDGNRASTQILYGLPPYSIVIENSNPDHWWKLDGDYDDFAGANPMNTTNVEPNGFSNTEISEGTTRSWRVQGGRRECANSSSMNTTVTQNRLMGGWIRVGGISTQFSCLYEEGGGVNNLAFFLGIGNTLIAQLADTGDDNVQAFSNVSLEPGRDYHILFKFSYTDGSNRFDLYLDAVQQTSTSGNPLTSTNLDAHSGDISFGGPGGNLEVGGTDVLFNRQEDTYYSNWVTYSTETDQELIDKLFKRGAIPTYTITSDTQAGMQAQLDALSGTNVPNAPLSLRIEGESGGGALDLTLTDFVFNDLTTITVEYRGEAPLSITNLGTSNLTSDRLFTPNGATVTILNPAQLTLSGLVAGTEVRVFEAGTINEVAGVEASGTSETFQLLGIPLVDIAIAKVDYVFQRLEGVDTSASVSLPIQQRFDRNYNNP